MIFYAFLLDWHDFLSLFYGNTYNWITGPKTMLKDEAVSELNFWDGLFLFRILIFSFLPRFPVSLLKKFINWELFLMLFFELGPDIRSFMPLSWQCCEQ